MPLRDYLGTCVVGAFDFFEGVKKPYDPYGTPENLRQSAEISFAFADILKPLPGDHIPGIFTNKRGQ